MSLSAWWPHLFDLDNETRIGLNVGLGCEWRLSPEISVGLDMKYNITKYDQALAAFRVAYHF
jgi:hypothetical protein